MDDYTYSNSKDIKYLIILFILAFLFFWFISEFLPEEKCYVDYGTGPGGYPVTICE